MTSLDFDVRDDWGAGFVADLAVAAGSEDLTGWTVSFTAPFEITNIWNADILSHEGDRYVIGNAPWNAEIAAGQTAAFGFQASGGAATPAAIEIDGVAPDAPVDDTPVDDDPVDDDPVDEDPVDDDPVDDSPADDGAPTVTAGDVAVTEGDVQILGGNTGFFHADGSQLVDSDGNAVRITGVNWFGFESETSAPHGLWSRNYKDMMAEMREAGFNTIRLPINNEMFDAGRQTTGIDAHANPDLYGKSPIEVLDAIVAEAGDIGMRIILDMHRNDAGMGALHGGLWYNDEYSQERWIDDWTMLAERYAGDPTVIGADLFNEPHGPATWGSGDPATDWAMAAETAGNAIQAVNPDWLILVEGVEFHDGQNYWWGGNLAGVRERPIDLDIQEKLVYSPHAYPGSIYQQSWFSDPAFPENLPAKWTDIWGYIPQEDIAPVMIGEFGSRLTEHDDILWMEKFVDYLDGDFDGDGQSDLAPGETGLNFTFWSWNPNSGDTGGILLDDWQTLDQAKLDLLGASLTDFPAVSGDGETTEIATTTATVEISLDAAADGPIDIAWTTRDGTATAGADYEAASGTLTLAAGETAASVDVTLLRDGLEEDDETFDLVFTGPDGTETVATVTIDDDDGAGDDDTPVADDDTPADDGGTVIAGDGLDLLFNVNDDWGAGFVAEMAVTNASGGALDDWTVTFDLDAEITNIWNAEIVSRAGTTYVVEAADWNATLADGASTSFGFQAEGDAILL